MLCRGMVGGQWVGAGVVAGAGLMAAGLCTGWSETSRRPLRHARPGRASENADMEDVSHLAADGVGSDGGGLLRGDHGGGADVGHGRWWWL